MQRRSRSGAFLATLLCGFFVLPTSVAAGSLSVTVSPESIGSRGVFRLTMASEGMASCVWSRFDNGASWAWKDQSLPQGNGAAYDSGLLVGWPGPASYRWDFHCSDGAGGVYTSSAQLSIQAAGVSTQSSIASVFTSINIRIVSDETEQLTVTVHDEPSEVIREVIPTGETICVSNCSTGTIPLIVSVDDPPPPPPEPPPPVVTESTPATSGPALPVIFVAPDPTMYFNGVPVGQSRVDTFVVENRGSAGTLLSGSASILGSNFFCDAGCSYADLAPGEQHHVHIRFTSAGLAGDRFAEAEFEGGGGARRFVSGSVLWPAPPQGSLDFGKVTIGRSKNLDLLIRNDENVDLGSGVLIVAAPFACVSTCSYNLPPHSIARIPLSFTPEQPGEALRVSSLTGVPGAQFTLRGVGIQARFKMLER